MTAPWHAQQSEHGCECHNDHFHSRLSHAQRMEDIHTLTGGICHHFNNQLATILGYLELSRQLADESENLLLDNYLAKVNIAAEQMKELVAQLRRFCSSPGKSAKPLCLGEMVEESRSFLSAAVGPGVNIEFDLSLHDSASQCLMVNADMVQLQQVLMILINNAVKAMDNQGTVKVVLSEVNVGGAVCDGCLRPINGHYGVVSVIDHGVGIEAQHRAKLFMPFFTTRQADGGTGMGLSVVHGIMHEHQGHVVVESKPGQGSRFELLLPVVTDPVAIENTAAR